jgi:[ribosomal protein S18]-alanine N-acetyltransferase
LNIRIATPADIPAIVKLERDSETASHWTDENYNSIFSSSSPQRLAIVMESQGAIEAFVVARVFGGEWEIESIVVASGRRQRGIGSALVREVINLASAATAETIFLEVRQSNFPARALYRKMGFAESGLRESYYRDPQENAICYSFRLLPSAV